MFDALPKDSPGRLGLDIVRYVWLGTIVRAAAWLVRKWLVKVGEAFLEFGSNNIGDEACKFLGPAIEKKLEHRPPWTGLT